MEELSIEQKVKRYIEQKATRIKSAERRIIHESKIFQKTKKAHIYL